MPDKGTPTLQPIYMSALVILLQGVALVGTYNAFAFDVFACFLLYFGECLRCSFAFVTVWGVDPRVGFRGFRLLVIS